MLRKLASILLTALILFQLFGYRLTLAAFEHVANQESLARINAGQYQESDLYELKFPLTLPYPRNMPDFERTNGEMEHEGKIYQYVQLRWHNDTLTLKCLRDDKRSDIRQSTRDHVASQNETGSNTPGKNSLPKFKLLDDFIPFSEGSSMHITITSKMDFSHHTHTLPDMNYSPEIPPPVFKS